VISTDRSAERYLVPGSWYRLHRSGCWL
jgi:hypothetical protein